MTLHEIEETLHTLQSRHDGLNEEMLVTLLRGGGWEEKNIQEAVLLFRSGVVPPKKDAASKEAAAVTEEEFLPPPQTDPVLMPQADERHLLLEHNEEVLPHGDAGERKVPEAQSLIEPSSETATPRKKDEIPHNLPLRPFETSEHVWPFSRYRDIFYGDSEPEPKLEMKEETKRGDFAGDQAQKGDVKDGGAAPFPAEEAKTEKKEEGDAEKTPVAVPARAPEKEIIPVPLTKGDEKLVVLACVMLLVILLLLGYMYSNGRL